MSILALDVGGTAIKSGLLEEDGSFLLSAEHPSDAHKGGPFLMERIYEIISLYSGYDKIGISTAGQVDAKNGVIVFANQNIPHYTGMQVRELVAERFHVPVFVENDVNCAALGEAYYGAGKGFDDFLCLTYGTGIGGAIIINRRLYKGFKGIAAEFGHMVTHANGLPCGCGLFGCYEQYASTRALVREARKADEDCESGRAIFAKLESPAVQKAVDCWIDEIIIGLASLIHVFNPPCIVLGGGIMNEDYILNEIRNKLPRHVMESCRDTVINKASLGNKAGMLGAMKLTLND